MEKEETADTTTWWIDVVSRGWAEKKNHQEDISASAHLPVILKLHLLKPTLKPRVRAMRVTGGVDLI